MFATHSRRGLLPALLGIAAAILLAQPAPLAAQGTGTVRGTITGANARPLDVATVSIVGTRIGARTRDDGAYQLNNVPAGPQQLRVVRIGYGAEVRSITVVAGQTVTVDFALSETPFALEELVVTGTAAEARKKEIGNSMASISSEELKSVPVSNLQDVIGARAAGVTVLTNSGQPGAGGTIRLRGNNSLSQGNNPIVYVDGIRIYSENGPVGLQSRQSTLTMNDIPASDIERIEIVKGAAATTLYGTEASGGVIQIFTKKGSAGAPIWDVSMGFGYNELNHIGSGDDPTGMFLKVCRSDELLVDTNGNRFTDPTCPESGSWLQRGLVQRYDLGVRGGNELFTYSLSGNYTGEGGVIETGQAKTGGFRGNFSFTPHSKLNLQLSTGYTRKNIQWVPDGNNASGFLLNVNRGPFNNYKGGKGECEGITGTCVTNLYVLDELNLNRSDHFISGLVANWTVNEKFTNRFAVGYDYVYSDDQNARPFGNLRSPLGFIWKVDWLHTKLSLDYSGSYRTNLGSELVSTSSWGGQFFQDKDNYTRVDGDDFAGPGEPTLGGAARATVQETSRLRVINAGFFAQQMFGWRDRMFLTAGLRVDGNSSFGDDFGLQAYPKVSLAYVLSEEGWFPSGIETFKLRFAAGESGKAPGAFDAVRTWSPVAGDEGKPGFTPSQIGNPELGPERTREIEAGFDMVALDGRLGFEVTGYHTRTYDALVPVTYPSTSGFLASQLENVGTIQNQGLEFTVDGDLIRSDNLDFRARLNLALLRSEAIDIDGQVIEFGNSRSQVREGFAIPSYFGPKITNPDAFADPIIENDQYLGANYPTRITSIQATAVVARRITIDALGEWQAGAFLANWVGYQNGRRGIWPLCYPIQAKLKAAKAGDASALNDVTALDRYRCGSDAIDRTKLDFNWWIESSDFFKLRTVSVNYDIPQSFANRLGFRSAALTMAARNLFTITDYTGTDPEATDARDGGATILGRRDYYNIPPSRQFLFSLRLGF